MKIITEKISYKELKSLSENPFDYMVKAVADIEMEIIAVGAAMHSDEEAVLMDNGSLQENLWGFNILFDMPSEDRIEFDSVINIRPKQNRSRFIEDKEIKKRIIELVNKLIQ